MGETKQSFHHNLLAIITVPTHALMVADVLVSVMAFTPMNTLIFVITLIPIGRGNSAYGGENGSYNIVNNYYNQTSTPVSKNNA